MKKYILSLGLLLPSILFGQIDRSIRPEAAPAPQINIEDSEVFKTENGITVILSENHKLPRVSFNLVMGSTPQAFGSFAGLSEIAGSLIMSGTTNRTKDQLDSEKDYIGASLSADENSIYLSCLTKHMDKGLELMSDVLRNANFPQSEVDRIIEMQESGLMATKSDAGSMVSNVRSVANFPSNHPYGEVMTEESLANINRELIVKYYQMMFTPNESYLVIVGDINKAQAEELVKKTFGDWTGGNVNKTALPPANSNTGTRVLFVKKPGAVQSVISVTYPMNIKPSDEDYLKLQVLNGILGGGVFGNRLMQNLREDKAYTYGCRSNIRVTENGSYMTTGGNFRNEVTDSSIVQILFELDRIQEGYVTDEELNMTKASMAGSFSRSLEQPSTIARFALSIIKNDLPKDYYQTYLKKLESITKEDLLMVAQKYINSGKANIVVVGNEEIIDKLEQFDADGKIEKLDAFGQPVVDRLEADITADELLDNYVSYITGGLSGKQLAKKMKKMKSYKAEMEVTMAQVPAPLKTTSIWISPNIEGSKMEMQGMTINTEYFDGEKGGSTNMQTGAKELTAEEISAKKKSQGIIPELNYKSTGMEYSILGIEEYNGVMCYVLKLNDGQNESFEYFNKEDYSKVANVTILTNEGQSFEKTTLFSDYVSYEGLLFPDTVKLLVNGMTMNGKVTSRELNAKVDIEDFK